MWATKKRQRSLCCVWAQWIHVKLVVLSSGACTGTGTLSLPPCSPKHCGVSLVVRGPSAVTSLVGSGQLEMFSVVSGLWEFCGLFDLDGEEQFVKAARDLREREPADYIVLMRENVKREVQHSRKSQHTHTYIQHSKVCVKIPLNRF